MNRKRMLLSSISLIFITLFALMVWALNTSTEISNVALVSPIARQNISGNMVINISAAHITGGNGNITNVTIDFSNRSTGETMGVYTLTDTDRSRNTSLSNISTIGGAVNTANSNFGFSDGYFNVSNISSWNASDNVALTNLTALKIAGSDSQQDFFIVDNTFPEVRGFNESNRVNYTTNQNITVRVTLTNNTGDLASGTDLHKVRFQILYFNGSSNNLTDVWMKNVTGLIANVYNVTWNATINATSEGNHTVKIFVNDTAGNMNNTQNATFLVDLTAPTTSLFNLS